MVNHNSRGVVMDLVDAGVYEKDFELVWANKRNVGGGDDESSSPYTPKTPDASSPIDKPITKSEYTGCCDSTSTTAESSTVTSMSIITTSAVTVTSSSISTQTFQDASDRSTSMSSISSSSCFPSSTSSISTPTMDALTSSPTSTSKLSPNTIASTTTSIMNATALNENSSTLSQLSDTQGTFTKHEHTSSALAVTVSVAVIVSLIALAVVAFLVRRKLRKQSRRNEELEERGEKPATGVEAFVAGMGIRKNGNGGSEDIEAPRPEMKRNPSVSASEAGNEATLDRAEMETLRARSTISSGWGDGLSIHSLELNENEPVQGLSIRPQTRSPPGRNEYDGDINSYYDTTKYGQNPFADPEPENGNLNTVPGFQPINLPNLDFDRYRSDTNPTSPGDLTRDYLRNKNAILSGRREPSITSETDILERQREMEGEDSGEITEQPRAGRWSNPFTAREKRGTRAYEEMGGEERREGRWRDARSWVKEQVERVKDR